MARKDRTIAGFDDVAGDKGQDNANDINNNNDNVNVDVNLEQNSANNDSDFLDTILEGKKKNKNELVLTGIYLQPDLAHLLDKLGKQGGRGAKSRIVNDALRKVFNEKGLL